ncbi:MAG: SDR family oxidoreductase [Chloroflexi bacterium]|nr:SDR family oxidoreductase [Chloroflexota bacterium]
MPANLRLDGRVAVITGGGTGIGRAISLALAKAGADIVVSARRLQPLEDVADEITRLGRKAMTVSCDVTKSEEVDSMVGRVLLEFGHADIMVNNAGVVKEHEPKPMWEITDDEWRLGIDTNLTSAFYCCRALSKHMINRKSGVVINLASDTAIRAMAGRFMYTVGKAGIINLTQALAITWVDFGIRVNCITLGMFRTWRSGEEYERSARVIPVGKVGEPEDVGPMAVYLASDASSYITGQVFIIDGGTLAAGYAPSNYQPVIPLQD